MRDEWISWDVHPVPDDVKGIFIKYADGKVFSDRYNPDGSRKFYQEAAVIGWKFMERRNPNIKSVQCQWSMPEVI